MRSELSSEAADCPPLRLNRAIWPSPRPNRSESPAGQVAIVPGTNAAAIERPVLEKLSADNIDDIGDLREIGRFHVGPGDDPVGRAEDARSDLEVGEGKARDIGGERHQEAAAL